MSDGPSYSPEADMSSSKVVRPSTSQGEVLAPQGAVSENKNQILQREGGNENENKNNNERITLYKSDKFEVFVPKKPNIPLNEGLHVQVSDGHDGTDSPREVLARMWMAEGVAKEIAGLDIPDFWANTRIEKGQVVSIYGMNPVNEKIWRKPVNTLDRNVPEITDLGPEYKTSELQKISARYLSLWEQQARNTELFKNGVNGKDVNIPSNEGFVLWENEKIKLEVIVKPHLKGLHLMVSPKDRYQRQWQTVTDSESQPYLEATMETMAIAMAVQELMGGEGEVHTSGNWNGDLMSKQEGGKLDFDRFKEDKPEEEKTEEEKSKKTKYDPYLEKRAHRPDIATTENQIGTVMHTHVYLPENGGPVILPEMSRDEATKKGRDDIIKQWDANGQTTEAQLVEIRAKLGEGKLTKWLEDNCKGQLISKTT
jgi:hypothetical protein